MKKMVLGMLLIFFVTTFAAAETDWDRNGLNGKVKKLTVFGHGKIKELYDYDLYGYLTKGQKYKQNGSLDRTISYEHDKAGNLTKEAIYDAQYGSLSWWTVWEYDRFGNRIDKKVYSKDSDKFQSRSTWEYDGNGEVIKSTRLEHNFDHSAFYTFVYEYDGNGKMIKEAIYYSEDLNLQSSNKYIYDGIGNMEKKEEYRSNGQLKGYELFEYDKNRYLMKSTRYYPDGVLGSSQIFTYDSYGNVIKKIVKLQAKVTDVIEYRFEYRDAGAIIKAVLNDSDVRVRTNPTTKGSRIIVSLDKGDKVFILGKSKNEERIGKMSAPWYKIKTEDGTVGYSYGYFFDVDKNELEAVPVF